ncbi:MAG: hypothetical protein Q7T44_12865 [Parvibaculum sp.]|nr:hypothetical protein [Parvibaculum sp.]
MSAATLPDVKFLPAWKLENPKFERDAIEMWKETGRLMPGVSAEARAKELVAVAYSGDRLVAISTAQIHIYEPLRQRFAFMRLLVRPEAEKSGLVVPLTFLFRESLRQWSLANPQAEVAGYAAVIANQGYGARPVLNAGLTLVGYTDKGSQIRVCWWDHFKLAAD